jgi:hypothetical protein
MPKKQSKSKPEPKGWADSMKTHCGWCDRYGLLEYSVVNQERCLGRDTEINNIRYFCNQNCFKAFQLQELSIDIIKQIKGIKDVIEGNKQRLLIHFKDENKTPENIEEAKDAIVFTKAAKAQLIYLEGLIARDKKQVLHEYRRKLVKLYGDVLERWMTTDKTHALIDQICNAIAKYKDNDDDKNIHGGEFEIEVFGT